MSESEDVRELIEWFNGIVEELEQLKKRLTALEQQVAQLSKSIPIRYASCAPEVMRKCPWRKDCREVHG